MLLVRVRGDKLNAASGCGRDGVGVDLCVGPRRTHRFAPTPLSERLATLLPSKREDTVEEPRVRWTANGVRWEANGVRWKANGVRWKANGVWRKGNEDRRKANGVRWKANGVWWKGNEDRRKANGVRWKANGVRRTYGRHNSIPTPATIPHSTDRIP